MGQKMNAIRLHITGRVQAVGFRAFVKRHAEHLGLTGWVRNCEDGSVEVFAQGNEVALRQLEEACAVGPLSAQVEHVSKEQGKPEVLSSFKILP